MEKLVEKMKMLQFKDEDILDFELNSNDEILRIVTNELENLT